MAVNDPFGTPFGGQTSATNQILSLKVELAQNQAVINNSKISRTSAKYRNAMARISQINAKIEELSGAASQERSDAEAEAASVKAAQQAQQQAQAAKGIAVLEAAGAAREAGVKARTSADAAKLRQQAARARDAGQTKKAADFEAQARAKEAGIPQFEAAVGRMEPTAPAAGKAPTGAEIPPTAESKWLHGLKPKAEDIIWQNADGSWGKKTITEIMQKISSDKNVATRVRNLLIDNGYDKKYFTGKGAIDNVRTAWQEFALQSQQSGVSPFEYKKWAAQNLPDWAQGGTAAGGAGGGAPKTTTYTQSSKTIDTTQHTAQNIRASVNDAFQKYLGRDVTAAELRDITDRLNAYEEKHPQVVAGTTKTTTTRATGATTSSTVTPRTASGGVDYRSYIEQRAKEMPESQQYQAATTYYDTFLNAIRGQFGRGL